MFRPLTLLIVGACVAACASSPSSSPQDSGDGNHSDAARPDTNVDAGTDDVGGCEARATGAPTFVKQTIDTAYRAEGVGVLDVDGDGHLDIATDQFWYEGPSMITPHEIRTPVVFSTTTQYADCFGVYPRDYDGDGFLDILVAPHVMDAMFWYRNPAGARDAHWTQHLVAAAGVSGLETPYVVDLFRDGSPPVLLTTDSAAHVIGWSEPKSDPTLPWDLHVIANGDAGFLGWRPFTHGIGVGDVDGDGRLDVLTSSGWFQQTADRAKWNWHPVPFGDPAGACSRMFAYDFDGDGRNDILCARPHDYGLYWFRQAAPASGTEPTFVEHLIDATLSEMHALRFEDLDGDGIPEIITGKRWLAHGDASDPGAHDPAQLRYFALRDAGTSAVSFELHPIDEDSGVGGTFAIADVDGDCKKDIVTSNKKGLFFFRQQ